MERNSALEYCAGAAAILNYHKVADDIADERGWKKIRAFLIRPFVAHARKKAIKKNPQLGELDSSVAQKLQELSRIEREASPSVDTPAACFGELLGEIVSFGFEGADGRIAYQLGKNIGAWIYIADAIDDMDEDFKKGRYNPFIRLYGGRLPQGDELTSISMAVRNQLYGAEAAVDLMEIESDTVRNIIQNIIYLGITERTDGIIKAYTKEEEKKKGETEDD